MNRIKNLFLFTLLALVSCSGPPKDRLSSWTHFRGDALNGISPDKGIPTFWNDSTNLAWKTGIPGKGWSSPLILGNQVWLTTAFQETREMRALCLDTESGEIRKNILLFRPDSLYRIHAVNSYATPTGAIEEGRVYLHFGRYGTACLDTGSGERLWERTDMQCEHIQGPGSSLLIHGDMLIVHMEGSDIQHIYALDKYTGETIWRIERPAELWDRLEPIGKKAYITPIVVGVNGMELLISNGSAACIAYNVKTGQEVWRIVYGIDSSIAMPVESDGLVYFYTSFETDSAGSDIARLIAVDPTGEGDLWESHVRWWMDAPRLQLSTPVVVEGILYTVDTKNVMHGIDAKSGEILWSERLKGKYNASPVYADGHLYVCSTGGDVHVIASGNRFHELSEMKTDGEIWATPAIAGGALYIRTARSLYKIGG